MAATKPKKQASKPRKKAPAKKKPANAKRQRSKFTNAQITQQQLDALDYHAQGYSIRQIGESLGVSHGTAENRLNDALKDHEVHARYELYRADQLFHTKNMIRRLLGLIHEWNATSAKVVGRGDQQTVCLLYTSPSPRD